MHWLSDLFGFNMFALLRVSKLLASSLLLLSLLIEYPADAVLHDSPLLLMNTGGIVPETSRTNRIVVLERNKRALTIPPPLKESEIPDEIMKIWYTNESFDILTLRWGSQGSPELFALFKWREQLESESRDKLGSRLYVSHDYGATFANVTSLMQCSNQTTPTALSTIYWTESTTNTIMVTDTINRCLHVSHDAGYTFKSTQLKFIPSRLEIHPRFDNVLVAHDVDSKADVSHNPKGVWISFNYGADWQNVDDIVAGWRLGTDDFDPKANCSACVRVWIFREEAEMPHLKILVYEYTKDGLTTQRPVVKKERVNEFEIKGSFMFAVVYDETRRTRTLLVSFRGSQFVTANFGNLTREVVDYHIAHVSQSQAYVALTFDNNECDLYMSGHGDGNFTRSLSNVYFIHPKIGKLPLHSSGVIKTTFYKTQALVDIYAVEGLDGVMFANQVRRRSTAATSTTTKADEEISEYLVTKMTEDGGSTWHLVRAPMRSVTGDLLNCSEVRGNCSLHLSLRFTLHSHTRDPQAMWSSKNAPGIVLGVGNWGVELNEISNRSLFRSVDGGMSWEHSLHGQHMFSVANKGGLIAAISDAGATKTVLYSWNYGTTWNKLFLPTGTAPSSTAAAVTTTKPALNSTLKMQSTKSPFVQYDWAAPAQARLNVIQILSEPGINSTVFNVYATPVDSRAGVVTPARHAWIIYRIDLKAIFQGRRCTPADFDQWSFQDVHQHVGCLLGRKTVYHRRKVRSMCLVEDGVAPAPNATSCECQIEDYECDVGFSAASELKLMCLPDGSAPFFIPHSCPPNSTFLLTHGYRKRPFDSCSGGLEESMQPVAVPCPDEQFHHFYAGGINNNSNNTSRNVSSDNGGRGGGIITGSRGCPPQTFDCRKGMCIPRYWMCDGEPDCADGADERDCHLLQCLQGEFKCTRTHRCIPEAWKCDAQFDCGGTDLSDELNCTTLECSEDSFRCLNKTQCIPRQYLCDRELDCIDGSDELNCTYGSFSNMQMPTDVSSDPTTLEREHCNFPHYFSCAGNATTSTSGTTNSNGGACIPARWQCDGEADCPDGSDERNCAGQCRQFVCNNGNCIRSELVCDDADDCGDGSDEVSCLTAVYNNKTKVEPFDPARSGLSTTSTTTSVPAFPWLIDEGNDKPEIGSADDSFSKCTPEMPHKCRGKPGHTGYCIPKKWVCDGTADCIDASDEQDCGPMNVQKPTKKLKFDLNGPKVISSDNEVGGATVAGGDASLLRAGGAHHVNKAEHHHFGTTFLVLMLFVISIVAVIVGVLYKQGRLSILQRRGFAFRRFQNDEPTIAMTGNHRRASGPYANPRGEPFDEGFVDESMAVYDIMPHSSSSSSAAGTSSNRLQFRPSVPLSTTSSSSSYHDGGVESVTLGIDEQPMFVHFSDNDPLVGDPVHHDGADNNSGSSSSINFKPNGSSSSSSNKKASPSRVASSVRT